MLSCHNVLGSSRLGKGFELRYDARGRLVSASVRGHLLEKARVADAARAGGSFGVFYQLCAGVDDRERRALQLDAGAGSYRYLDAPGRPGGEEVTERARHLSPFAIPPVIPHAVLRPGRAGRSRWRVACGRTPAGQAARQRTRTRQVGPSRHTVASSLDCYWSVCGVCVTV